MPSRPDGQRAFAFALSLALALGSSAAYAASAEPAAAAPRFPLDAAAVQAAASAVRRETGQGQTRRVNTWRFKRKQQDEAEPPPSNVGWLISLGRWIAEGGRVLVWLGGAALLAIVIVMARRWIAVHGVLPSAGARLPSHIRELDIRPESLPADIGAAVRALWLQGEHRAALSLLYRGALSRLVHHHAVPIEAASTEGDCVRLARAALPAEQGAFVGALVQVWLLAIYGNRQPESSRVMALCDGFERMLPASLLPAQPALR